MKLEISSIALRRERAAAQRGWLKELADRLAPLTLAGEWLARLGKTGRNPNLTPTHRCPS